MPDAHKNFAFTYVVTPPSPADSGTSLTVTTGSAVLFPATPFNATVWPSGQRPLATNAEIIRVTNITGDTLTITRAQESTTARSILAGDQISATITAKAMEDVESDVLALQSSVTPLVSSVALLEGSVNVLGTTALRNPNPTLEGYTQTKAEVIPYTAIAVGSIGTVDVTLPANIFAATYSGSGTLYYSNLTPTAGTRTRLKIETGATPRTVVIPQTWSNTRSSYITSLTVPGSSTLATLLEYTGARWEMYGDPIDDSLKTYPIGFTADGGGSAVPTGKIKGFATAKATGTIRAWSMTVDTGTPVVKVWKIASGAAKPTAANSINTSGVGVTGADTNVRSTVLTDFTTTTATQGDIFAFNIESNTGSATEMSFGLEIVIS